MASIIQVGVKWRAQVRRKGHVPITQTFSTKKLAQIWAAKTEAELEARRAGLGAIKGKVGVPLSTIFQKASQDPAAGKTKLNVIHHLNNGLGHIQLESLTAQHVIDYISGRGYAPSTGQQEISILGTVLRIAELAWGYYVPPVMKQARTALKLLGKTSKSRCRERRPTAVELQRLGEWFDQHTSLPLKDLMWFSIHTAMRASEVTGLRWSDYNARDKTIIIRDRKDPRNKQGNHQEVPLLDAAVEIIERQPRTLDPNTRDFIFPYNHRTFSSLFPRACQLMEHRIKDLRWHDLRHEGTSRLFEMGYHIHEVSMFTGHKDWKQLKRYTQLRAKDLRRLDGSRATGNGAAAINALFNEPSMPSVVDMASAEIAQEIPEIEARAQRLTEIEKHVCERRRLYAERRAELEEEQARRQSRRKRTG